VAYLPASSAPRPTVPVFVILHGALRTVEFFVEGLRPIADETGVMVVAPYAVAGTWDAVRDTFGPDVRGVDATLAWTFGVIPADPARLTLAGFSDGATYALGLGRANGDLFSRVVAFSPGFLLDVSEVQRPGIVVSHGTQDSVLPYASSRDVIVPTLRSRGYGVEFHSFDGGHALSLAVAQAEFRRMVA
jgi:phospholipase/carboxylesterase